MTGEQGQKSQGGSEFSFHEGGGGAQFFLPGSLPPSTQNNFRLHHLLLFIVTFMISKLNYKCPSGNIFLSCILKVQSQAIRILHGVMKISARDKKWRGVVIFVVPTGSLFLSYQLLHRDWNPFNSNPHLRPKKEIVNECFFRLLFIQTSEKANLDMQAPEPFDTTFFDTDTILIPSSTEISIPIRY